MVHELRPAGDLRPLRGRRRVSGRRVLLLLLILGLVGSLLWWWGSRHTPKSLTDTALVGQRGPGCVRVIIASDESGSMTDFIGPRERALAQLLNWVPNNLRPDDELSVLTFSGDTFISLPPTAIGSQPVLRATPDATDGTSLDSVIQVIRTMPATPCVRSLVLLSDGIFQDLPGDSTTARTRLRDSDITELFLLVPGKKIPIEPTWNQLFPYATPVVFNGYDPDQTGLAFGRTLALVTGQELRAR